MLFRVLGHVFDMQRPEISHLPSAVEMRTRQERQAEKQAVAAERRAIKNPRGDT